MWDNCIFLPLKIVFFDLKKESQSIDFTQYFGIDLMIAHIKIQFEINSQQSGELCPEFNYLRGKIKVRPFIIFFFISLSPFFKCNEDVFYKLHFLSIKEVVVAKKYRHV